jgi:hypothetical protein
LFAVAEGLVRPQAQAPDARRSAHQEVGRRTTLALGSAFALAGLAAGPGRATAAALPAGASKSTRAGAAFETPAVRGLDRPEEQQVVRNFKKLASGVRYADLKEGTGAELTPGSIAVCQWVLRRAGASSRRCTRRERPRARARVRIACVRELTAILGARPLSANGCRLSD